MKKAVLVLTVASLLLLGFWGCQKKKPVIDPNLASSDEALFKAGQEIMKKDAEKARLYFRQVIDSFPRSFYAQRAKLAIADSYFKVGDEGSMILTASEYREFINLYPYSPSASYAQYQIAMTYFKKSLKAGRDQTKTIQALTEFKAVITRYPLSEEAKLAEEKIRECEERLASHDLEICIHYYRVRAYKAAVDRLREILITYPTFSRMDAVYFYLADSYLNWKQEDQSIPFFTKLITDYPESKYTKKAQKRLDKINKRRPEE